MRSDLKSASNVRRYEVTAEKEIETLVRISFSVESEKKKIIWKKNNQYMKNFVILVREAKKNLRDRRS